MAKKQELLVEDAKVGRREAVNKAESTVYCGPDISGIAKQYTVFTGSLPPGLRSAINERPILNNLLLPLSRLPEARKQLCERSGSIYSLYCLAMQGQHRR